MATTLSIEGFEDVEYLGQGGLSVVYRARQVAFNRVVALKVMRIGAENEEAARLFDRECTAAGRLAWHPNVVSIYDRGVVDGHLYLVLEFYGGATLDREVQSRGALPIDEVTRLGIKLCGALVTAHSEGVLHRDIKPQNVLLSSLGEPALSDFGLAAIAGQSATTTGAGFSPAFSPPEVYSGAVPHARGDIFSLGATLMYAATGTAPFGRSGATVASIVGDVINGRIADPPRALAHSPLCDVLSRSMATVPADRYATAADFADALQRVEEAEGGTPTALPTVDTATVPPGSQRPDAAPSVAPDADDAATAPGDPPTGAGDRRRRKRALAVGGLVVLGLLGAAALAIGLLSSTDDSPTASADAAATTAAAQDPCRDVEVADPFSTVLDERQLGFVEGSRADAPEGCDLPEAPGSAEAMLAGAFVLPLLDGAAWTNLGTQGIMDAPAVASFAGTNFFPGAECWAMSIPDVVIVDDARTIWSQERYILSANFFDTATAADAQGLFEFNSLVNGTDRGECTGFDGDGLTVWPSDASVAYQDIPVDVDGVRVNMRDIPGARAPAELALSDSDHLYRMTAWRDGRIVEVDLVSNRGPIVPTRASTFFTALVETYFPS